MSEPRQERDAPATAARPRRWPRVLAFFAVLALALVAGGAHWLSTQDALDALIARAVAHSQGRLNVEGANGSLLSTMRIERLRWTDDEVILTATDVVLTWSPIDLLSRRFYVRSLTAQQLVIALQPSAGQATLPTSLALPLEIAIARAGIGRVDWRLGEQHGTVTDVSFAYAGGATRHRLSDLALVTGFGTVSGALSVDAGAPFAVVGKGAFVGGGDLRDAAADAEVKGTLEALDLNARIALRGAHGTGTARLTPFSPVSVAAVELTLADIDLQRLDATLPTTRLGARLDAAPDAGGFSGTVEATNSEGGTLDSGRIPVSALKARFAWTANAVDLPELTATLPGAGSMTGNLRYDLDRGGARVDLRLRAVDLRRIHSALVTTALDGSVSGDLTGRRQTLRGTLSQSNMQVAFDAILEQRIVDVARFRARAGTGEIAGTGRVALDGSRAFSVDGTARNFDPAQFGAFPTGSLSASFKAMGALAPGWSVSGEVNIAPGSKLAGMPASGSLRGDVDARHWRNAMAKLRVADAELTLSGNVGNSGDKLVFALDIPDLGTLRPLFAAAAAKPPERMRGALRASGWVSIQPEGSGLEVDAHGRNLEWGVALGAAAIDARAHLPPAAGMIAASASRRVAMTASASGLRTPQGTYAAARVDVSGTLLSHAIDMTLRGEGVDAHALVTGGFHGTSEASPDGVPWPWTGSVDKLQNKGELAVQLELPANLEVSGSRVHLSRARLHVVEGAADIDEFVWDDGRITSRGSFLGVPVTALARLAGRPLPIRSTLTLKGSWAVAAAPRLDGIIDIARDSGDLYGTDTDTLDAERAIGITTLVISARFAGDAVSARGQLRSLRASNADATLTLDALPDAPPGRIAAGAPLTATLNADITSLRPFQTWLGTLAAIDGRAHLDLAARGTLAEPVLSGELTADDLRISLPQHGVMIRDGRVRSHLAGDRLLLDELSLFAGEGSFTARGTLAAAPRSGVTPDVTWHADHFRIVNRPDLRFVIGGDGTLAIVSGKLVLAGNIVVGDGRVIYEQITEGRLGDDVVVVGWPPRANSGSSANLGDLRLGLDLHVDLESGVVFTGEGLETRLVGGVHLVTSANGTLEAKGRINASRGTYFALGQKLTIERGALIFDGPADNPALDVVALRKNLAVEAGVEVTGTVRVPRVRLVSNPPVPDNEILSWLISGQPLDRASRTDVVALAAASAALLGRNQRPLTQTIANTVGLDDISVHESSVATATGLASGQVVAFGKRVTDRLSVVFEQGLTIATNALRVEYELTRNLTLRAGAGTVGSLGVYYRRSFD